MNLIETLKSVGGVKPCNSCVKFRGYKLAADEKGNGYHNCGGKQNLCTRDGDTYTCTACGYQDSGVHISCDVCHGTGQSFDLAPLLAKPSALEAVAVILLKIEEEVSTEGLCGCCLRKLNGDNSNGFCSLECQDRWKTTHTVSGNAYGYAMDSGRGNYGPLSGEKPPARVVIQKPLFKERLANLHVVCPARCTTLGYEVARQLGGTAVVAEPKYRDYVCDVPCFHHTLEVEGYSLSLPIPPDATVLFVTDRMDEQEMRSVIEKVAGMRVRDGSPSWKYLTYVLCLVSAVEKFDMPYGPHEGEWKVISLHKEKA